MGERIFEWGILISLVCVLFMAIASVDLTMDKTIFALFMLISISIFVLAMLLQFVNSKNKILAMFIFILWNLSNLISDYAIDKFIK